MENAYSTSPVFCLATNKSALGLQLSSADSQDSFAACHWLSNLILVSRLQFQSKAPVKRSRLFIQQRTTFVVKKKFLPFDHLVVCCCIMLHEVCSRSKMFVQQCCVIEHFFCFLRCCMLLLSFDHFPKLCCVRACAVGF